MTQRMLKARAVMDAPTGIDLGARPDRVVVEDYHVTPTRLAKRARVADALTRIDMTPGQRGAAMAYRQAVQHVDAGRPMGPPPWLSEAAGRWRSGGGGLTGQEAALSAADWLRMGVQAMGLAASQGVVNWVVIAELPLSEYDAVRRWRRHTARDQLLAALTRLAEAYGCA